MLSRFKADRVVFLAFQNALRLHFDAASLYDQGRHPSAFFLSVLSQEEIGKMHIINDYAWHRDTSDDPQDYANELEKKYIEAIFVHSIKQAHFVRNSPIENNLSRRGDKIMQEVLDGVLDEKKQDSVYVGFTRKKRKIDTAGPIKHPWQITQKMAKAQITKMSDYLLVFGLGLRYTSFSFENEQVEYTWRGKRLLKSVASIWEYRSRSAKKQIKALQKLLKENVVSF